jgi:hypothetical protein
MHSQMQSNVPQNQWSIQSLFFDFRLVVLSQLLLFLHPRSKKGNVVALNANAFLLSAFQNKKNTLVRCSISLQNNSPDLKDLFCDPKLGLGLTTFFHMLNKVQHNTLFLF